MMARAMICQVCFREVAVVGRRCADCGAVELAQAPAKGKRRTVPCGTADAAELLAMADTDPQAALAALEAL